MFSVLSLATISLILVPQQITNYVCIDTLHSHRPIVGVVINQQLL